MMKAMPGDTHHAPLPVQVSAWVRRYAGLVTPGGKVLDVAAGGGRHARWLADAGFRVTAVDIDISALRNLPSGSGIQVVRSDLERGGWPFADGVFDGIVVVNYLHRPHFDWLMRSLASGGVLMFDTFSAGHERHGRPTNPRFLLRPGELQSAFDPDLEIIGSEEGMESFPRPAVRQKICARRRPGG